MSEVSERQEQLPWRRVPTFMIALCSVLTYLRAINITAVYGGIPGESFRNMQETTTTAAATEAATARQTVEDTFIPLSDLVRADETISCPEGFLAANQVVNLTANAGLGRKIPRIIHQTGETRCMTKMFHDNSEAWHFEGHSYYFHDAQSRQRLLQKYWPMFPQLQNSFECLKNAGGAAIADLWRYLALYEYGGIYVDLDDAPNKLMHATTIGADVDAFFLQDSNEILSQFFFAVSPKHPLMFLAIHDVMERMHSLDDTGTFYVPGTTGPRCLKRAFLKFMGVRSTTTGPLRRTNAWPKAGFYPGAVPGNRSVTVVGTSLSYQEWVKPNFGLVRMKEAEFGSMNFTDYQKLNKVPTNKTCLELMLENYQSEHQVMQQLHRRRW